MNKELVVPFANNLKRLREEKGLSLRELADKTGISKSSLSDYENALSDPSLTNIIIIAEYFDEDIGWLIGEAPRLKKIAK